MKLFAFALKVKKVSRVKHVRNARNASLTWPCLAAVGQVFAGGGVRQEVHGAGRPVSKHERQRASVEARDAVLFDDAQQAVDRTGVLGFGSVGSGPLGLCLTLQAHFHYVTWRHHRRL